MMERYQAHTYPKRKSTGLATIISIWGGLSIWAIASWITHVVVCLKAGSWGFLIAGAIVFPIAMIHGTGLWFGFF